MKICLLPPISVQLVELLRKSRQFTFSLLLLLLTSSCQQSLNSHQIQFVIDDEIKQLVCKPQLTINKERWQISQLQFYIHDIYLKNTAGDWVATQPTTNTTPPANEASQNKKNKTNTQISLSGGYCNQKQNWKLTVLSPLAENEINGLKFTLGVPASLNHLNPLTQPAPLNQPDMFWSWQLGHKFLRLEMKSESNKWLYHLGSTGCSSPSPVRAPKDLCKNPNLGQVELNNYKADTAINIDILSLVKDIPLNKDNSCQSSPARQSCKNLLPRTVAGKQQVLFKVAQ